MIDTALEETERNWTQRMKEARQSKELRIAGIEEKLRRLTDAYIEGMLGKEDLEQRKTTLLLERREIERNMNGIDGGGEKDRVHWQKNVELIRTAYLLYRNGNSEENGDLVKSILSNSIARHKSLDFTMRYPFSEIAKRPVVQFGCPPRTESRIFWQKLINDLVDPGQKGEASKDSFCA